MPVDEASPLGFVRAHRWLDTPAQRAKLRAAKCVVIHDLDKQARSDMLRIAGMRPVLLVHAFLLADADGARDMWADFQRALKEIEKQEGYVVDVGTGLNSRDNRPEFLDVVRGQVRRDKQGEKSAENHPKGTPGRPEAEYRKGDWRKAFQIWKGKDAMNFPTERAVKDELAKLKAINTGEPFSVQRAYRRWGKRGTRPRKPKD
jgi:hypothetical protein